MSYTIDYSNKPKGQALIDACEWLTDKQAKAVDKLYDNGCSEDLFYLGCSFAGIQGAPAKALYDFKKLTSESLAGYRTELLKSQTP